MRIGLLGPFEARLDDGPVSISSAKERALLSVLALRVGSTISMTGIIEALWGEYSPRSAAKAVQNYVLHLRRRLPPGAIETTPTGYRLLLPREAVDSYCFETSLQEGRTFEQEGRLGEARQVLTAALALWRGPALPDLADHPYGMAEIARLHELRYSAEERLLQWRLDAGEHELVVVEAELAVNEQPLRERRWAQLMLALYRSGRQAEALRAFSRLCTVLREELGIVPAAELAALEEAILLQRPELDYVMSERVSAAPSPARTASPAWSAGARVVSFAEVVSSGEVNLPWHVDLLETLSKRDGCVETGQVGRAVYSVFDDLERAVQWVRDVHTDIHSSESAAREPIRAALDLIEPGPGPLDFASGDADTAAALLRLARPGELLVTEGTGVDLRSRFSSAGQTLSPLGQYNLPHSIRERDVFAVVPTQAAMAPPNPGRRHVGFEDLPSEQKILIGRSDLVKAVLRHVCQHRLVALWGPAGVGKTRVAIRSAMLTAAPFLDGVRYVDLSVIRPETNIEEAILTVLRGAAIGGESAQDAVVRALESARTLLVLDNCEHLLAQIRAFWASIRDACPYVHMLITSREALWIDDEWRVEVAPLAVAPLGASTREICACDAVQLLEARIVDVDPNFHVSEDNAAKVRTICERLGGIPFSLELVAGRIDVETVDELASDAGPNDQLPPLSRSLEGEHRSGDLLPTLQRSYELLPDVERSMFLAMSTFAGSFSRVMALELLGVASSRDHIRAFDHLVRASMVTRDSHRSSRFRLLEAAAEFGRQTLPRRERDVLEERLASLMVGRAEQLRPLMLNDQEDRACELLGDDFANFRRVITWSFERSDLDKATRLIVSLFQFCHFQLLSEVNGWAARLVPVTPDDSPYSSEVFGAAALGAWFEGDTYAAITLGLRAVKCAPSAREPAAFWGRLALLDALAYSGRLDEVPEHFVALITASRASTERFWRINGLGYEAISLSMYGRPKQARERADEAVALARVLNNPDCLHWALYCLGRVLAPDDPIAACEAIEGAMRACRGVGSRWNLSIDLLEWSGLQQQLKETRKAAEGLLELLDLLVGSGNRSQLAQALMVVARLLADLGDNEDAFVVAKGRFGLPQMPKGAGPSAAEQAFLVHLESCLGPISTRLAVRAVAMSPAEVIELCRSKLNGVITHG